MGLGGGFCGKVKEGGAGVSPHLTWFLMGHVGPGKA